jgi:hypothetical protein
MARPKTLGDRITVRLKSGKLDEIEAVRRPDEALQEAVRDMIEVGLAARRSTVTMEGS